MTKTATRLLGGGAVMIMAAAMALSGTTYGLERPAPETSGRATTQGRILVAQADGTPVSFSVEQADRGKKEFSKECMECHGKDLKGGLLGGPPLRGQSFEEKYGKGAPAGVLFEIMSTTMPPNAPGSYAPNVYADLMAFILKTNGYKAGAELPADSETLYKLVVEK